MIDRRIASLDIVRGFAVLGILAANVVGFARTGPYYYWGILQPVTFWEEAGWLVQYLFLDGKLRGLFAFLFGAGMAIFVERAAAKRGMGGALLLQGRRLLWLALFGAAHYYLLFFGDILLDYAMVGLVAMLFLPMGTRGLLFFGLFASFYLAIMSAVALFPAGEIAALEAPPASALRQRLRRTGRCDGRRKAAPAMPCARRAVSPTWSHGGTRRAACGTGSPSCRSRGRAISG